MESGVQAPSLQDDDFRLFGLPMGFALDRAEVTALNCDQRFHR